MKRVADEPIFNLTFIYF